MRELIFCCPKCLCIDSTGVTVGSEQTIETIRHYPMLLDCRHCHRYAVVPVFNTMISDQLDANLGLFRSFENAQKLDEAGMHFAGWRASAQD